MSYFTNAILFINFGCKLRGGGGVGNFLHFFFSFIVFRAVSLFFFLNNIRAKIRAIILKCQVAYLVVVKTIKLRAL